MQRRSSMSVPKQKTPEAGQALRAFVYSRAGSGSQILIISSALFTFIIYIICLKEMQVIIFYFSHCII